MPCGRLDKFTIVNFDQSPILVCWRVKTPVSPSFVQNPNFLWQNNPFNPIMIPSKVETNFQFYLLFIASITYVRYLQDLIVQLEGAHWSYHKDEVLSKLTFQKWLHQILWNVCHSDVWHISITYKFHNVQCSDMLN